MRKRRPVLISEVAQIPKDVNFHPNKKDFKELVELPLRKACEKLYKLNVPVFSSSANVGDVKYGRTANIGILYNKLSEDNKRVADRMIKDGYATLGAVTKQGNQFLTIKIPISEVSTVKYVQRESVKIASQFEEQDLTWAFRYTPEEFVSISGYESLKGLSPEDMARQGEAFYDKNSGWIYFDKEHYEKALKYEKWVKKRRKGK